MDEPCFQQATALRRIEGQALKMEEVKGNEDWISEPVLWTKDWPHLGFLSAVQETELILVDPKIFASIVQLNPPVYWVA